MRRRPTLEDVKKNGYELLNLPEDERTPEICHVAVFQTPALIRIIKQTPELCLLAIRRSPYLLRFIENQTKEL